MQLTLYLSFNGQCEAAFKFYERCLGGKIECIMPYESRPAEYPVPVEWRNKILHVTLRVGDQVLMGADAPPDRVKTPRLLGNPWQGPGRGRTYIQSLGRKRDSRNGASRDVLGGSLRRGSFRHTVDSQLRAPCLHGRCKQSEPVRTGLSGAAPNRDGIEYSCTGSIPGSIAFEPLSPLKYHAGEIAVRSAPGFRRLRLGRNGLAASLTPRRILPRSATVGHRRARPRGQCGLLC
jgi:hypothetical protein